MGVQELRAECQRRGLGTARARADLIQRLTADDAQGDAAFEDDFADSAETAEEAASGNEPADPVDAASVASAEPAIASVSPGTFRQEFQAEPGGPDEETHLACRDATRQAAIEAGYTPRGDARLAATVEGRWVYEILVRQVT